MEKYFNTISVIISVIGCALANLVGGFDLAIKVLALFMLIDYILGVMDSLIEKTTSSKVGVKGLFKKASILVVVIVAVNLDRLLNTDAFMFKNLVTFFYIANEGISILENCAKLGVPIPKEITNTLIQIQDKEDD